VVTPSTRRYVKVRTWVSGVRWIDIRGARPRSWSGRVVAFSIRMGLLWSRWPASRPVRVRGPNGFVHSYGEGVVCGARRPSHNRKSPTVGRGRRRIEQRGLSCTRRPDHSQHSTRSGLRPVQQALDLAKLAVATHEGRDSRGYGLPHREARSGRTTLRPPWGYPAGTA
jgi:hypothetical protein